MTTPKELMDTLGIHTPAGEALAALEELSMAAVLADSIYGGSEESSSEESSSEESSSEESSSEESSSEESSSEESSSEESSSAPPPPAFVVSGTGSGADGDYAAMGLDGAGNAYWQNANGFYIYRGTGGMGPCYFIGTVLGAAGTNLNTYWVNFAATLGNPAGGSWQVAGSGAGASFGLPTVTAG